MKRDFKALVQSEQFRLRGIFIGTYIPRRCGIATFTKDLSNAINVLNPRFMAEIMTMDDAREPVDYPWEVKMRIQKENRADYSAAADYINKSSADYVCLQHEYGIFGGESGEYILDLIHAIKKPFITTFHTTLQNPDKKQKQILVKLARQSKVCVVMIKEAAVRLKTIYGVPEEKIVIIPHGVPDIPFSPAELFKTTVGFKKDDFIIGSINLVADNKGLEYVLQAMPEIIKIEPRAKFLMVGQTHPIVKLRSGEKYREKLQDLAVKLKLSDHFVEINEYISLEQLVAYLRALDIYITPYTNFNQTSSGTLSYAIGAGKICISTPYIYAREVLDRDRGILVPSENSSAIADAVISVIENPEFREKIEHNAYDYGRQMIWERVAVDYLNLARLIVNNHFI